MPRPSRPDDRTGSAGEAQPWAADEAQAGPPPQPGSAETAQMPLFQVDASPAPRARRVRLRHRIKALLSARIKRRAEPPRSTGGDTPGSSWPDSFFDTPPGP